MTREQLRDVPLPNLAQWIREKTGRRVEEEWLKAALDLYCSDAEA